MKKKTLGQVLKSQREILGLTQRELALKLDVKASHVAYLEMGRRRPSLALLKRLADVLQLDRWQLFLLAHPEAKSLLESSADLAPSKDPAKAWQRFVSSKTLRARYHITAREIQNRLNEITFNGALMGELRAIDFVNRLLDSGKLSPADYMRPFVHRIDGGEILRPYSATTKFDASLPLISQFFEFGRNAAKDWLDKTYAALGNESTLDLRMAFTEG